MEVSMYIPYFFGILTLSFGLLFLFLKMKRPQTIWLGISFINFLFNFAMIFVVIFLQNDILVPLIIIAVLFTIFIFTMPFLMVGTFLINGIKVIRNEGFKFSNLLSLLFGISVLGYLFIWPSIVDITKNNFLNTVYQFISFNVLYFSFILLCYTVANSLNLMHIRKTKIDYFITLGAGLTGEKVTPLLAGRIDKAIELQQKQKHGKIVFSGGQGEDEVIPEGEAMAQYALDQGVNPEIIIKETNSESTHQNIQYSKHLIDLDWRAKTEPKIAIVTNYYHVLRGLMQAHSLGIDCIGYGSHSKFYFSLNAFLREFVAYLQMTYKVHSLIISFVGLILFILYLILQLSI